MYDIFKINKKIIQHKLNMEYTTGVGIQPGEEEIKPEKERPQSFDEFLLNLHDSVPASITERNPRLTDNLQAWCEYTAGFLSVRQTTDLGTPVMPLVELAKRGAEALGRKYPADFWAGASYSQLEELARQADMEIFLAVTDPRQSPSITNPPMLADPELTLFILEEMGVVDSSRLGQAQGEAARAAWREGENVSTFLQESVIRYFRRGEQSGILIKPEGPFNPDGSKRTLGYADPGKFYYLFGLPFGNMKDQAVQLKVNFENSQPDNGPVIPPFLSFLVSGEQVLSYRYDRPPGFLALIEKMSGNVRRKWPPGGLSWEQATGQAVL